MLARGPPPLRGPADAVPRGFGARAAAWRSSRPPRAPGRAA